MRQNEEQLHADPDEERGWYVNSQSQTFVILDADEFQMGSPAAEAGHLPTEPLHRRRIGRRFAIGTTEVTKTQWRACPEVNQVFPADQQQLQPYTRSDDSPMLSMTWYEAAWYCNWLSAQEVIPETDWCYEPNEQGKYAPGMRAKEGFLKLTGYRMPTEAEWEFSCRAGVNTSRYYGQTETLLTRYAWYLANGDNHAWPVATLKPNDFGLFDMHGNAFEWCYDAYKDYPSGADVAVSDLPSVEPLTDGGRRVLRGGSFFDSAQTARSALRLNFSPDFRYRGVGFRVARTYP